ncbi:MAG: S8 family serine peptidase, partial [Chloroflexota bacterium]
MRSRIWPFVLAALLALSALPVQAASPAQETPAPPATPAPEITPAAEATPVPEATPAAEETPPAEELPAPEATPAAEEALPAQPKSSKKPARGGLDATDRYIVVMAKGADTKKVRDRHIDREGLKADRFYGKAVRGFSGKLTAEQRQALEADPDVAAVIPDEIVEIAAQTIPTGVRRTGSLATISAQIDGVDKRVHADVAIVDTGIDGGHPDLAVVGGVNCTTPDRDAWGDGHGHGTHVAGTVAAKDNGIGVVGVAPGARLWAVKILNNEGFGYLSWYICGLDWIAAQRDPTDPALPLIEAANMSVAKWGRDDFNCGLTSADILHQGICRVVASGVSVAVAAGNDSNSAAARVPAAYDEVITVSALADMDGKPGGLGGDRCLSWGTYDVDDTFADFSNFGADVDIIAPGKCIMSTMPGSGYAYMSGTSMATPHVTGAIALYKATRPWATPAMVRAALLYLSSSNWKLWTDPDAYPDRLLDVSKLGPAGDFSVSIPAPVPFGEAGGTVTLPITITRTPTHFETLDLSATTPPGFPVALDQLSLTGFTATAATVTVTVPPSLPAGSYPVVVTAAEGTRTRAATVQIVVENDPPTANPPAAAPVYKTSITGATTAQVRVVWPAATDPSSAIAGYELEYSYNLGPWQPSGIAAGSATAAVRTVALNRAHRFRIRARDAVGIWSPWVEGPLLRLGIVQNTSSAMKYSFGWYQSASASASGGSTRYTTRRNASVRLTMMAQTLSIVAPVGPNRGTAKIYVNGVFQATISLYWKVGVSRRIVWTKTFDADGLKTLEIR